MKIVATLLLCLSSLLSLQVAAQQVHPPKPPDTVKLATNMQLIVAHHYDYYSVKDQQQIATLPQYRQFKELGKSLYAFAKSYESWIYGIKNSNDQLIIPPRFKRIEPFKAGFAQVQVGRHWGLIDTTGAYVLPPIYRFGFQFKHGLIEAVDTLDKYCVFNKKGAFLFHALPPSIYPAPRAQFFLHDEYYSFSKTNEGYVLLDFKGNRRVLKGDEVLEDKSLCLYLNFLSQGKSPSCFEDMPLIYSLYSLNPDVHFINFASQALYYNSAEDRFIKDGWRTATPDRDYQHSLIAKTGGGMGIIASDGSLLIDFDYELIQYLTASDYKVKQKGQYGIMDKATLSLRTPISYDSIKATTFTDVFLVKQKKGWSLLDLPQQRSSFLSHAPAVSCQQGLFVARDTMGKIAIIDTAGQLIIPPLEAFPGSIKIDPSGIRISATGGQLLYTHQGQLIKPFGVRTLNKLGDEYYYFNWDSAKLYDEEGQLKASFDAYVGLTAHRQMWGMMDTLLVFLNMDGKPAKHSEVFHNQARQLANEDAFVKASALMVQAYQNNPYDYQAYFNAAKYRLMDTIHLQKQIPLAQQELDHLKGFMRNGETILLEVSIHIAKEEFKEALSLLKTKYQLDHKTLHDEAVSYHFLLAYLYTQLNDEQAAAREQATAEEQNFIPYSNAWLTNLKIQHPFLAQLLQHEKQ